jgi:type II secretory pathway component PulM
MNPRALWAAFRAWYASHSSRDRRILAGVGVAVALSLVYVGLVEPVLAYRQSVAEEIAEGQEALERAARFLGAADALRVEREQLRRRLEQAKARLLPGDSGTLGAAALQERANAIATEKGIRVASAQVMREEVAEPFRKVAVRLQVSGELGPFADFVSGLEYGPQQLSIPFVEITRRGAVAGAQGPRTLSAKVEVSGYLMGAAEPAPGGEAAEASLGVDGAPAAEGPPAAEAAPVAEGAPAAAAELVGPPAPAPAPPAAGAP